LGHGGTVRAGDYIFSVVKETKIINWEKNFFVHHRMVSAVKRVEFVSDRTSYLVLRGRWCNTIVLNVHTPSEEKSDDSKDSFDEEVEQVFFYRFPKYRMELLLADFNTKLEREKIFSNGQLGIKRLQQQSNDNGVKIVNFNLHKI
jgi:hypothetical protein